MRNCWKRNLCNRFAPINSPIKKSKIDVHVFFMGIFRWTAHYIWRRLFFWFRPSFGRIFDRLLEVGLSWNLGSCFESIRFRWFSINLSTQNLKKKWLTKSFLIAWAETVSKRFRQRHERKTKIWKKICPRAHWIFFRNV